MKQNNSSSSQASQQQQQQVPVNVLIDELKSDEIRKRINSLQNLHVIAQALGTARTRSELLPFLGELMDDEDEVLLAMAESLQRNFIDLVGGAEHAASLFPVLENLAKVEDSTVRDTACRSLRTVVQIMDIKRNEDVLVQLIKRLNESSYYLSKGAVAMLIPAIYRKLTSTNQSELYQMYTKLVLDAKPSVRKFASQNFKDYVALHPTISEENIRTAFENLLKDDQDFVRLYVVDALVALTLTDIASKNQSFFTSVVGRLANDASWRIKYYLCEKIDGLIKGMGKELFQAHLLPQYISYLNDQEPELRSVAASKLNVIGPYVSGDEIIQKIIPIAKTLSTDAQNYVRIALSSSFLSLSSIVGKKGTTDHILPTFLQLLKDEDSDVRINLFKKLSEITKILGLETLSQSVIPALTTLAQDKSWRIRHSSIEIISFFAREIGKDFLNDKIIAILMSWLQDKVFAVREKSIECIKNLITIMGSQWTEQNVMPKILTLQSVPNYLQRMTVLFIISSIADKLSEDYLTKIIVPVIVALSKDAVPNVRMNACKTIRQTNKFIKDKETLKKLLAALKDDSDADVKYWCSQAIESLAA